MTRISKSMLHVMRDEVLEVLRRYHREDLDLDFLVQLISDTSFRPNLTSARYTAADHLAFELCRLDVLRDLGGGRFRFHKVAVDRAIAICQRERDSKVPSLEQEFTYRTSTISKPHHAASVEDAREFYEAKGVDLSKIDLKVDVDGVYMPVILVYRSKGGSREDTQEATQ